MLIFKRGHAVEVQRGRLLLPKLDYAQILLVRVVGRLISGGVRSAWQGATGAARQWALQAAEVMAGAGQLEQPGEEQSEQHTEQPASVQHSAQPGLQEAEQAGQHEEQSQQCGEQSALQQGRAGQHREQLEQHSAQPELQQDQAHQRGEQSEQHEEGQSGQQEKQLGQRDERPGQHEGHLGQHEQEAVAAAKKEGLGDATGSQEADGGAVAGAPKDLVQSAIAQALDVVAAAAPVAMQVGQHMGLHPGEALASEARAAEGRGQEGMPYVQAEAGPGRGGQQASTTPDAAQQPVSIDVQPEHSRQVFEDSSQKLGHRNQEPEHSGQERNADHSGVLDDITAPSVPLGAAFAPQASAAEASTAVAAAAGAPVAEASASEASASGVSAAKALSAEASTSETPASNGSTNNGSAGASSRTNVAGDSGGAVLGLGSSAAPGWLQEVPRKAQPRWKEVLASLRATGEAALWVCMCMLLLRTEGNAGG